MSEWWTFFLMGQPCYFATFRGQRTQWYQPWVLPPPLLMFYKANTVNLKAINERGSHYVQSSPIHTVHWIIIWSGWAHQMLYLVGVSTIYYVPLFVTKLTVVNETHLRSRQMWRPLNYKFLTSVNDRIVLLLVQHLFLHPPRIKFCLITNTISVCTTGHTNRCEGE